MNKFDLYVTSIPNNNAKLIIARHIAALNHSIPLQTAMSMAEKPPLLLLSNLELNEAQQHVARLKMSGIGFKVVESKVMPKEEDDILIDSTAQNRSSADHDELIDDSMQSTPAPQRDSNDVYDEPPASVNFADENKQTRNNYNENSVDDNKQPDRQAVNQQKNTVTQESSKASQHNVNGADDKNLPAKPTENQQKNDLGQESAKKDKRDEKKRSDKKRDDKKTVSSDDKKKRSNDKSANDKKQHHERMFSTKTEQNKFKSGIRIGSFERAEKSQKRSSRKQTIIVMSIFIGAAIILFFLSQEKSFAVQSSNTHAQEKTRKEKSAEKRQNKKEGKKSRAQKDDTQKSAPGAPSQSEARKEVTPQQRHQANAFVDSARTLGSDPESIIAFYKLAISFNPQNLAAWQGLLQAYRDLERDADVRKTQEEMRRIFGERIESINLVVKPFGELIDTYVNDDGTYRVEYRSNKRSKNDITNDVFLLTRAVRTSCSCDNISIYASTGTGRGLISHSDKSTSVHTLSAFSTQAQLVWLD
ncbi:MAG: hypothetical protein FWE57_00250 [Chitinispirillia bacterium]|nr:hypothetical protein [Chitinispirillia bacterium]